MASWNSAPPTTGNSPTAPRIIPPNDRPIPISTLWTAIPRDRLAIRIASARRSSRSTTRTTSAASEDAVAPRAPMATPTSAAARAGASFTPSPTMTVTPPSPSAFTASTLSVGSRSDRIRSTPIEMPTDSATSGWSPVTITTRLIPARRRVRITRGVSGRMGSSRISPPVTSPSMATKTAEEPSIADRRRMSRARAGKPRPPDTHDDLPTDTRRPSTVPSMPEPGSSDTSTGNESARPRCRAARTMAAPRT